MKFRCRWTLSGIFLIFVLAVLSSCQGRSPAQSSVAQTPLPSQPAVSQSLFPGNWDDLSVFRAGLIQSEQTVLEGQNTRSIYRLDLQIAPDYLSLQGKEEVRYTNTETVSLDSIYFQLFPNFSEGQTSVSTVVVNGQTASYAYQSQNRAVKVPLQTPLKPGEKADIQVDFSLKIPTTQSGNYGLFTYNKGILALDDFYPVIPVYDEAGWRVLSELSPNADKTYLDASYYLVRVTAPLNLTLISSGSAVYTEHQSENQVVVFAAGPARDYYLAGGQSLNMVSQTLGETTIKSYAFSDFRNGSSAALNTAVKALEIFSRRLVNYPYTELDIVCLPMTSGALGIEYPGVAGINLDIYRDGQNMESTVAHEAGHQWFYNLVGNDQINQPWLDESLTQYLTGLYYLDGYGQSGWQGFRESWVNRWNRVDQAEIPIGLPAGNYQGREYSAIVYGRGPLFLEALSQAMGPEVFNRFLQNYCKNKKWEISTTAYFKELAESECSCDLTRLFNDWVFPR